MGVHPVQHHPDAPGVGLRAQLGKILLGTQHGVRGLVVAGVVAVAGKAFADGIQVEDRDPQPRDIVQLFHNAPEVAAEEVVIEDGAVLLRLPGDLLVPIFVDRVGGELAGKVRASGFREPVREDLVDHRPPGPVRGIVLLGDAVQHPQVPGFHIGVVSLLEQAEAALVVVDDKVIEVKSPLLQCEVPPEDPVGAVPGLRIQGKGKGGGAVLPGYQAVHPFGAYRLRHMDAHSTKLPRRQYPKGRLILGQLAVIQDPHEMKPPSL